MQLTIGGLFYEGNLHSSDRRRDALKLAIEDVNNAGGVLGSDVVLEEELVAHTDGRATDQSLQEAVNRLAEKDVDAVVTALISDDQLRLPDLPGGLVQISGNQTSSELSGSDRGRYLRTIPSDALQGRLIADRVIATNPNTTVLLRESGSSYGDSLAEAYQARLVELGAGPASEEVYSQVDDDLLDAVIAGGADSVVFFGFDADAAALVLGLASRQRLEGVDLWLSDASDDVATKVAERGGAVELLNGARLIYPSPDSSRRTADEFQNRVNESASGSTETFAFTYLPEIYDAATLIALAASSARCDGASEFADHIAFSSTAGAKCGSFETCHELLRSGEDPNIDYDGVSGDVDLNDTGDLQRGGYRLDTFGNDGIDESKRIYILEPVVETTPVVRIPRIEFEEGSSELDSDDFPRLETAIEILSRDDVTSVEIQGYESIEPGGTDGALADMRANVVFEYLVSRGVPAEKLDPVGKFETDKFPINTVAVFVDRSDR